MSKLPDSRGRLPGSSENYAKRKFGRPRKRKRVFNQRNDDSPASKRTKRSISASSRKITNVESETCVTKNRIIDTSILFPELENFLCCKKCNGKVEFSESGFRGLGFTIDVQCQQCKEKIVINSSKKVGNKMNAQEINRRSVLASRALGQGYAGLSTFCGIMDLPPPVAHSAFDKINEHLHEACESVAEESMAAAVKEEVAATPPQSPGIVVSGDGTWRKRGGFSSLQGVSSLIGYNTGKVTDVVVKNSFCKPCTSWEGKQDTAEYQEWYENHKDKCSANHEGSAGKMEVDGVLDMFLRSEEKYQVKYQCYVGDGDSKVFHGISAAKPYGDNLLVEKKECVGHVQKRMGTRLRDIKKKSTGHPLSDGKSIGGKGRLTAKVIDQLSSYYGKAIRDNNSVEDMSKAIWATFYHKRSTDSEPQHHLCPEGTSSWCKWQKAKALKRLKHFRHKSSIPSAVMDKIKDIYVDLTNKDLLKRCIGGYTQNNNESFNNSVWKLVPKTSFSGVTVLKIGVNIAVTCFNDGRNGFLKIMKQFGITPGHSAVQWVQTSNDARLFHAERKVLSNTKEVRQIRRERQQPVQDDFYRAGAH